MKIRFLTFGCKVNQYETQALREQFIRAGFTPTSGRADLYVINTCAVTRQAESKSREAVRRAKKENIRARIVVCGCAVEGNDAFGKREGADYCISQNDKPRLADIICGCQSGTKDTWSMAISDFPNQRVFVKIQDGCDNFCSFCKIPFLRGRSRSRDNREVLAEIERLGKNREIVLCGVNLGCYGKDFSSSYVLADLLSDIVALPDLGRVRLSSLEPNSVTHRLLEFLKHPKVCPHLHLPFQSGDDYILEQMNKRERVSLYYDVVAAARRVRSDVAISCDILSGFPGEENTHFEHTISFLRNIRPMRMHVFTFSPREKTKFSSFKVRNRDVVQNRTRVLRQIGKQFAVQYAKECVDKNAVMVAEEICDGKVFGYTEQYVRASLKGYAPQGTMVPVRIVAAEPGGVRVRIRDGSRLREAVCV